MSTAPASPLGALLGTGLALGRVAAGAMEAVLPRGGDRLAWQELGNKLDAFRWFQEGRTGAPAAAGRVDPFVQLWLTEGAGYRRAEAAPEGARPRPVEAPGGRPGELLPLHTGLGLSLASRALAGVPAARPEALGSALDRFLAAARAVATPGWEGAVAEALGLVVRTLHPHRLHAVDGELARRGGPLRELFWHGVGRGIYFAPTQTMPARGPARRGLEKALAEPPDGLGRSGAVAGLAWALTLVNLRSPEVVAGFLARHAGAGAPDGALEHGVCAALLVWTAAVGRGPALEAFLEHAPRSGVEAEAWHRVVAPAARALEELTPAFAATGRWEELFRFRPLDRLREELASPAPGRGS